MTDLRRTPLRDLRQDLRRDPPEAMGFDEKLAACPRARAVYRAVRDSRWRDDLPDARLAALVREQEQHGAPVQLSMFETEDREARIRGAVADFLRKNGRAKR